MNTLIGEQPKPPLRPENGGAAYRVSWVYRAIGIVGAIFMPAIDVLAARQSGDWWSRSAWTQHLFSLVMIACGIWIGAGVVTTDNPRNYQDAALALTLCEVERG